MSAARAVPAEGEGPPRPGGSAGVPARAAAPDGVVTRRMRLTDVPRVAELEHASFTAPWKPDTFAHLLERTGCELRVLEDGDAGVVAYAVLWCVLDQGELANIAVAGSHRGRGLGALLLGQIMEVARQRGVESLFLEVRVSNESAIALYHSFGFTETGRRKKYYDKPVEDALVMMARLPGSATAPETRPR